MKAISGIREARSLPNSLTSHLKCKDSPVRQFMEDYFGATRKVTGRSNAVLRQCETATPAHRAYGTVGTAIDRRIRFYFPGAAEKEADEHGVTMQGAYALCALRDWEIGSVVSFFEALKQFVSRTNPGTRLSDTDEDILCRFAVNLAWFDQAFRAGPRVLENAPLMQCERLSVDDLLEIVPTVWVDDLKVLSRMFFDTAHDWLGEPPRLGPTFDGSQNVGGADADMILGTSLIDVKTTVDPKVTRDGLWQILGYALLDFSDAYSLDTAGFYFARQGQFIEWPLVELARDCSSGSIESWPTARDRFRRMALALHSS